MKLSRTTLANLLRLSNGESIAASGLRKDIAEELRKEGLLTVRTQGSRRTMRAVDSAALRLYVEANYTMMDLDEAAAIAAHVYGDKADDLLIGGWRVSQLILELNYNNPASGFKSNLYERVVDGVVIEYVYATAGTEDGRDWIANVTQLTGLSYQYLKSGENAKAISAALSNMELNFVGHSLGGGEAALNSILTSSESLIGRKAFTFNAAGVSKATKFFVGGMSALKKSENEIMAYITITDPLNIIQNNNYNFIGNNLPDVNGIRHYMIPKCLNGHSIDNFLK